MENRLMIYRSIRRTEILKVSRLLNACGVGAYRGWLKYKVITVDNPNNKGRRLIIAAIGFDGNEIKHFGLYPAHKKQMVEIFKQIKKSDTSFKTTSPVTIVSLIQAGWYMEKVTKSGIIFSGKEIIQKEPLSYKTTQITWKDIFQSPAYVYVKKFVPYRKIPLYDLRDLLELEQKIRLPLIREIPKSSLSYVLGIETNLSAINIRSICDTGFFNYWHDSSGTSFVKRLESFLYKNYQVKLTSTQKSNISNRLKSYSWKEIVIQFTNNIDWIPGTFGDSGSCFLTYNRFMIDDLINSGHGYAMKIYTEDDMPTGRCLISIEEGVMFLFNFKGIEFRDEIVHSLSKYLNLNYRTDVSVSTRSPYYLDNYGWAIGRDIKPFHTLLWNK
jgi:hypothetical protein